LLTNDSTCHDYFNAPVSAQQAYDSTRHDLGSTGLGVEAVISGAWESNETMGEAVAQQTMGAPATLGDISCNTPGAMGNGNC
jgi:hypothetical protein